MRPREPRITFAGGLSVVFDVTQADAVATALRPPQVERRNRRRHALSPSFFGSAYLYIPAPIIRPPSTFST